MEKRLKRELQIAMSIAAITTLIAGTAAGQSRTTIGAPGTGEITVQGRLVEASRFHRQGFTVDGPFERKTSINWNATFSVADNVALNLGTGWAEFFASSGGSPSGARDTHDGRGDTTLGVTWRVHGQTPADGPNAAVKIRGRVPSPYDPGYTNSLGDGATELQGSVVNRARIPKPDTRDREPRGHRTAGRALRQGRRAERDIRVRRSVRTNQRAPADRSRVLDGRRRAGTRHRPRRLAAGPMAGPPRRPSRGRCHRTRRRQAVRGIRPQRRQGHLRTEHASVPDLHAELDARIRKTVAGRPVTPGYVEIDDPDPRTLRMIEQDGGLHVPSRCYSPPNTQTADEPFVASQGAGRSRSCSSAHSGHCCARDTGRRSTEPTNSAGPSASR